MLGSFLIGCAEERSPINRVQPEALAKSFFVGKDLRGTADDPEFYKRGTVIDVGYGAAQDGLFTSTYAQPVSRIRWEITEERINARLSYERISGTDDKGNALNGVTPKAANDGQIVASYAVSSHFDIRHEYNPQTGEELNVIVENSADRPWYDREYFRVDWSKNLVTDAYDYDTLSMMGVYGGIEYQPVSYTILDPKHPDAPHFDAKAGYFDVTNKVYASPKLVDLSGLGVGIDKFPACMLSASFRGGTDPYGNCNPTEITIRDSYRLVTDTDYEPADHDGVRFQVLGAFNFNYRRGYERNYGMLDQHWTRFLSRYNLWERSHYYTDPEQMTGSVPCATKETTEDPTGDPAADPNRDLDADGTADECAQAGAGSQCDVFKRRCTLPYAQRTARTIPWYIAGDTSVFEPTSWAVEEWDLALKTAVQTARLTECKHTGAADCDTRFPMWRGQQDDNDEAVRISAELNACHRRRGWTAPECDEAAREAAKAVASERGNPSDASTLAIAEVATLPPVLVLCHNPVTSDDHPACGEAGLAPRLGDLRYNTVLAIPNPQVPSAWGIMTDGDDPLTGEKVAGSMNIWTHVTDLAAQQLVDLVRYANGELATGDITNGKYVRDFALASKLSARGALPTIPKSEITQRLSAASELTPKDFELLTEKAPPPEVEQILRSGMVRALDVQARNDIASPGLAKLQSVMNRARGTDVETQLLNPAMFQLAGMSSSLAAGDQAIQLASPLALNNPLLRSRLREVKENALAARGACIVSEAPEPSSLAGVADILKRKFPPGEGETASQRDQRYQRMFQYVQRRYTYAVLAHEMGHSVGLRHNFVSSSAPLFYRPQYWQLRTQNGKMTTACTDAVDDGQSCVGPRYWDPPTDEEQSQLIWMWMQSTVMDYPGELTQDMLGLGATDFAAARFFYGDNVSVYTDPKYKAGTSIGLGIAQATDNFGGLFGIKYQLGRNQFHYSQLQRNFGVIKDCYSSSASAPSTWNTEVDGDFDPVLDGHVVSVAGKATKCRQQPVDYARYRDLRMPTSAETDGAYRGSPNVGFGGQQRVPYSFASDHWADLGNVSVLRHDNGADPYEQVQFLITTQEIRHILDNYRRDRSTFSVLEASNRSFSRYNEKLQGMAAGMGFLASIYSDLALNQGYAFDSLWPLVVNSNARENMLAATVAFDHFTRQLARPEPGDHFFRAAAFQDPVLRSASDPDDYGPDDGAKPNVVVPNGATGYLRDVGFGGHPLENTLSSTHGDFDVEYTENAGSYYDKINTALLFAESEDRFVSQSRRDFYDARFRAVGMADVLGQGFRRVIANSLTGDRSLLAPRVEADAKGMPLLDASADTSLDPNARLYPARPLGWPSFWPANGPEVCFPSNGRNACSSFTTGLPLDPVAPTNSAPIDPQIGWEVQKFMIAWTVALIKANEKTNWVDMMRLYRLGKDASPEIDQRVEWQDPISGEVYYARSFGTECLFGDAANGCAGGKLVEKGIAARVLEYANELTAKGYQLDEVMYPAQGRYPAGFNASGRAMFMRHPSGEPIVKADPAVKGISPLGNSLVAIADCDQNVNPACKPVTINQNHSAYELRNYKSVPDYLWQAGRVYGLFDPPSTRGTY
ncbi:MAG TPA: hypothetical protein VG937_06075 [Polyangiaceae bacterium]|nr:hypothetical protein [Polyangiaceae bacterium]